MMGQHTLIISSFNYIADMCFAYPNLTAFTIPNTVRYIGRGFYVCDSLTSIVIPR